MRRAILVLVTGALLASCASTINTEPVNTGPLGDGGTPGEECVPVDAKSPSAVIGIDALQNTSNETVTIDSVILAYPKQLKLTSVLLVPIAQHNLIGVALTYPPPQGPEPGVMWDQRRPAPGTTIAPGSLTENLVAMVTAEATTAQAAGLIVSYHNTGHRYILHTATRIRLQVSPSVCAP